MALSFELSPVDPVNESLGQLGKDPINDLEDTTDPVAVKAKLYYVSILRTMLRNHRWNFNDAPATELAQDATAVDSNFAYSYTLPADCVRVHTLNGNEERVWKEKGRKLLTNEATAVIEYGQWVTDPNVWDSMFYQAFVTFLAVRFAPAFNTDVAKASDLYEVYQRQEADAKAIDGQEGSQEAMSAPFYERLRDT